MLNDATSGDPRSRESCRRRALDYVDSGALARDLARLVARPSISQSEGRLEDLYAYLNDDVGPLLQRYGFEVAVYPNPEPGGPPVMIARHIEDQSRPTVLVYGHGDVCNGEAQRWREGLRPFALVQEGDRLYGRGTADNKIQHLINIVALGLLLETRGKLGFNVKIVIEMGEETGSPGLREFMREKRLELAADVLISSDGPRLAPATPTMFMGSRGLVEIGFSVCLRDGDHHSGNFGGLLADPALILAHALASVADSRGRILVPEWRPDGLSDDVRAVLAALPDPRHDADWGEPSLTSSERVFAWNAFTVIAMSSGSIDAPQGVISGSARAVGQLRFVTGTDMDGIVPALRRHLDHRGFEQVAVTLRGEPLKASRSPLDDRWVRFVCGSIERSTGHPPDLLPNLAGSLPNDLFTDILGLPTIWIPHAHADCGQHGPNEHALASIARQGMQIMTDLFLDIGED